MNVADQPTNAMKNNQIDTEIIDPTPQTTRIGWFSQITSMSPGYLAGYVIYYIIFISLSITQLLTGIHHTDDCPVERYIPIYLIVSGAVSVTIAIISIFKSALPASTQLQEKPNSINERLTRLASPEGLLSCFIFVLWLFDLAWFIAGNVWVFRTQYYVQYDDPIVKRSTFCEPCTWGVKFMIRCCKSKKDSS
ncbi:unnamed protein product [Adineta ricciae]|uniref:Uncharacterized protein n=1 Tax=Adineta ricciae TaxID=249248 RepID=A0A813NSY2_ADIRI|nr:unnamed protein product [Adineta ricciae]